MKIQIAKIIPVVLATATIAFGGAASARADDTVVTRLKVPFAFIVGDMQLPAGTYLVREMSVGSPVLEIASADGRQTVLAMTIPWSDHTPPAEPALVFEKVSDAYFLSGIVPADGNDRQIVLTPALMEREIMRSREHAAN